MTSKTPLNSAPPTFDLKFLLVGDSGSGKTHLCGTYTLGPVHFYMLDPGGEKTLYKLNQDREHPITIDSFPERQCKYNDFWKQVQRDEKAGFFKEMAEQKGLVVLADSISSANDMALQDIAKANGRTLSTQAAPMRIQDWGQLVSWMKSLISVANDLPCATALTAHLYTDKDDASGQIVARYPLITGQLRSSMGRYFDEVYLLEPQGSNYNIFFKEVNKFHAKSRLFEPRSVKGITMDEIAQAYLAGDDLSQRAKSSQNQQPK